MIGFLFFKKRENNFWILFIIRDHIVQDLCHQMHPVFAHNIVFMHRVGKEIYLFSSFHKFFDKHQIILHDYSVIIRSVNQQKLSF